MNRRTRSPTASSGRSISDPARKRLKFVLQVLISAGLVAFVVRQLDLSQVAALTLDGRDLVWLVAAFLLFNLSKIISALRLNLYQRHAGILLGERENLRLYYAGMFLNLFLPGGIGGDAYKILVLHRRQVAPVKTLIGITLLDRVSGLLMLLLLLCLLIPFLALPWPAGMVRAAAVAGIVIVAAVSLAAHHRVLGMRGRKLAAVHGYGLAVQCCQLACMAFLLACLPVSTGNYPAILAVFLASSIAAAVPLSVGGLGAREVVFLYGLQLLRLDPVHGVVAASAFFLITAVSSLLGAPLLGRFSAKPPVKAPMDCARREQ